MIKKLFIIASLVLSVGPSAAQPSEFAVKYRQLVLEPIRDSIMRALVVDGLLSQAAKPSDISNLADNADQKALFDMAQSRMQLLESIDKVIKSLGGSPFDIDKVMEESIDKAEEILK